MRSFIQRHSGVLIQLAFGIWVFAAWRLSGMPSPGFLGRLIPGAWFLSALLSGRSSTGRWFMPMAAAFTVSALLWTIHGSGWYFAAAIPVAGLAARGIEAAGSLKYGAVRGVIPLLFLVLFTAEVNSDEVRFAEIAASLTGTASEAYGEVLLRSGDISATVSHHTPVFPLVISPGLMAGDRWLRAVPVLLTLLAIMALSRIAGPVPAVAGALLYPGFSTLGLAMTGWPAAGIFALTLTLGSHRKHQLLRFLAVILLIALKMRYAGFAMGIILAEYACGRPRRGKWMIPVTLILGGTLLLAADRYLLGGQLFWLRYGNIESLRLIWINLFHRPLHTLSNAGWSLFDPEAGLFIRAPWAIPALFGLSILRVEDPALFRRAVIPSALYWLVLIVWTGTTWHGLPAPAGRVFLPMVPMLVLGLRRVWRNRETRLLVAFSIAVSALVTVYPPSRANYADGTDTLFALAGVNSGFSMIRSGPVALLLPVLAAVSLLVLLKSRVDSRGFLFLAVLVWAIGLGLPPALPEAEDLTGEGVQGALLYPRDPDPSERFFWFGSRQRLLEMSEPGHIILVPDALPGDTLVLEASSAGGMLLAGTDTICVDTPLMSLPSEYIAIGRRDGPLSDRPENRALQRYEVPVGTQGMLPVIWAGGPPVYIDRIGLR